MSNCIVSIGVGGWYADGIKRLERSLIHHGWSGGMELHTHYPKGCPTHQDDPYGFKVWAIENARSKGYDRVLWLDASAWAIGNPLPVFQRAETEGHYFWTSGYKSGNWCSDECLDYFGVTRDQAMNIDMLYALVMCLDFRSDRTKLFFDDLKRSLRDGMFRGPWKADGHPDERYLGHRHDQSCASLIAHKYGMSIDETHTLCHLYEPKMPDTVRLTFQGL